MMRVLLTAFDGEKNSSKLILDKITLRKINYKKIYLDNDYQKSVDQLIREIESNNYDLVFSFGQSPRVVSNEFKIETRGKKDLVKFTTNFDYKNFNFNLRKLGYKIILSEDAGNYFCNNLYFCGLEYIQKRKLKTKMLFVHVPLSDKIQDINSCAIDIQESIFSSINL